MKRREEKVFRLEKKRSLTFINVLSFLAMDVYSCSFHSHDLNINSPHSLSYIAYSVRSENMVLNQTISPG